MASVTLAEASKLGLDQLTTGVIENIVTVDALYQILPFHSINGNALTYNRENALGDVQLAGIDGVITAKNPATYTPVSTTLTTIVGDAEVNGLIQAQNVGGNAGNDPVALQIASKAKAVGRKYQELFINGDSGNTNQFDGLIKLATDSGNMIDGTSLALDFGMLDELIQSVKSKGSQVDFIVMPAAGHRKLAALLRALGGTTAEYVEMGGVRVLYYNGIPVLRNDWIPVDSMSGESFVFAGNFDDGSQSVGIAGLTAAMNMGIHVQPVGASETKDSDIWRVKFYSSLASYSNLGLAGINAVTF